MLYTSFNFELRTGKEPLKSDFMTIPSDVSDLHYLKLGLRNWNTY